jgi:hypothetical protein
MEIKLSELSLHNQKVLSYVGHMASTNELQYYRLEIDLTYKALGPSSTLTSEIEQAIRNYMLMMGKDTITEIER